VHFHVKKPILFCKLQTSQEKNEENKTFFFQKIFLSIIFCWIQIANQLAKQMQNGLISRKGQMTELRMLKTVQN
jgi:hypothetical protein